MLVAVYEVLSPFMTEMREGLAAVKTELTDIKRNLRSMEGKVNHLSAGVAAQKNTTTYGFAVLNSSVNFATEKLSSIESVQAKMKADIKTMKENVKTVKSELKSHKTTVAEELEVMLNNQNTMDLKLDLLDSKQDRMDSKQEILSLKQDRLGYRLTTVTSALEVRILSNTTRELNRSSERHVTLIQSQMSSVNASIRNELRMVKRLLGRNNTECENVEIETTQPEDLLRTLLNSQTQLELRVLSNITKEMEMSADYHVTRFESALESKLSSVNDSIKNGLREIEGQIAKNCTGSEMVEYLSSVTDGLELVVNNQDILQLELVALSNVTKELRRSADNHVIGIQSQLSSVESGIRNELMRIGSQIVSRNRTGTEAVEILSNEEVLERLAGVNTSISGQVNYIKRDLGHISSSVDRVIDRLQECTVSGGGQNCSRQQPKEVTCETLNCSQPLLEECTCDTSVEQMPTTNLEEECKVYCDTDCPREVVLRNYTCGGSGGWRRVVYLNMTDLNTNCPLCWQLKSYSKRTCGRVRTSRHSCDSVFFPVSGGNYTSVCGSIRAYQYGQPYAFYAFHTRQVTTIEGAYVSGVSLTHGSPRQHIWTFAAGYSEDQTTETYVCPCDATYSISIPPFVGGDYFCESGVNSGYPYNRLYSEDPLWDGQGCSSSSTCCSFNNPPYFTKQLPSPTSDRIEVRLCHLGSNDDSPVEFMELYVK